MNNPSEANEEVYHNPMVYVDDAFYVFGGSPDEDGLDTTIAKLDGDFVWTKVGDMNQRRAGHNVIFDGNYVLVVGGEKDYSLGSLPTEKCSISSGEVSCAVQRPYLHDYFFYPELFIVPPNFCKKQAV